MLPPASTSIRSAAGRSGRPGIRTISPVRATRKPAPGGDLDVADGEREARGAAAELGVVGERVLGLGHADRAGRRSRACGPCGAWPRPPGRMFTPSAPYMTRAIRSIFRSAGQSSGIERLVAGLGPRPRPRRPSRPARSPRAPLAEDVGRGAGRRPGPRSRRGRRSSSSGVSDANWLIATTRRLAEVRGAVEVGGQVLEPALDGRRVGRRQVASSATPPCILRARIVATITTAAGFRPAERHLRSKNFSPPRSKANPASVTA